MYLPRSIDVTVLRDPDTVRYSFSCPPNDTYAMNTKPNRVITINMMYVTRVSAASPSVRHITPNAGLILKYLNIRRVTRSTQMLSMLVLGARA